MKRTLIILGIALIAVLGLIIHYYPMLPVLNGYAAKKACSCAFIADRDLESILDEDLAFSPVNLASVKLDDQRKTATASVLGLQKAKAVYKDGLGCMLVYGDDQYDIRFATDRPQPRYVLDNLPWPYGSKPIDTLPANIDMDKLDAAFDYAFDTPGEFVKKTRALLVVQNDTLIKERYAPGFDADTEILGWSMTKSIANALTGILVYNDKLHVTDSILFDAWKNDDRKHIKLDNLLRMNSGLKWVEDYGTVSDVTKLLYMEEDIVRYATSKPLEFTPGEHWEYSSGTSNLLSGLIRNQFDNFIIYQAFPYIELFTKLGMTSAQLEADEAGNYVMSSYCYATPRDWAKFGILYLNNGEWQGERLFDEDWIDYSRRPTQGSNGLYGAHIWLNTDRNNFRSAPEDMYMFNGFQGQHVFVIPGKRLVIVRMGLSEWPEFDMDGVFNRILNAIESSEF